MHLQNSTAKTATVTVLYVSNPAMTPITQTLTIAPLGEIDVSQGAAGLLPNGFYGSAIISSDQPLAGTTQEINPADQVPYVPLTYVLCLNRGRWVPKT